MVLMWRHVMIIHFHSGGHAQLVSNIWFSTASLVLMKHRCIESTTSILWMRSLSVLRWISPLFWNGYLAPNRWPIRGRTNFPLWPLLAKVTKDLVFVSSSPLHHHVLLDLRCSPPSAIDHNIRRCPPMAQPLCRHRPHCNPQRRNRIWRIGCDCSASSTLQCHRDTRERGEATCTRTHGNLCKWWPFIY